MYFNPKGSKTQKSASWCWEENKKKQKEYQQIFYTWWRYLICSLACQVSTLSSGFFLNNFFLMIVLFNLCLSCFSNLVRKNKKQKAIHVVKFFIICNICNQKQIYMHGEINLWFGLIHLVNIWNSDNVTFCDKSHFFSFGWFTCMYFMFLDLPMYSQCIGTPVQIFPMDLSMVVYM